MPVQSFVGLGHYRYFARDPEFWTSFDGASAWRRFLHVTLPQTASVLFVIVLLRSIWMFTKFDTVWLLAGDGGVSRYIRTLPVYAYARSFTYLQAGMGAALAVIMFAMLLVATALYFRMFRTEEVFCLPFCLWVLRAFFQSIPLELEEAALVDGAGRGRTVWYVVLPLALPGLIAAAICTFILAWNDFLFALVLITSEELKTLPVGVNDLFNATIVDWGLIMAAGVMITVPTVCFFAAVQRYLVQGWGAGGVKG
jgi:ABC-type glycerol-3-phosphate transport system permease component